MTTAEELFKAASTVAVIPQTGRTREAVAHDLCKAIEIIPDDTWQTLSKAAKDWYNDCVGKINSGKPAIPIPGETFEEKEPLPEPPKKEEPKPEVKLPKLKTAPAPKAEVPALHLPKSASEILREIVIEHLDWKEADIQAEAVKRGAEFKILPGKFTENLVWTIRIYTIAAMKTAARMGWTLPAPTPLDKVDG